MFCPKIRLTYTFPPSIIKLLVVGIHGNRFVACSVMKASINAYRSLRMTVKDKAKQKELCRQHYERSKEAMKKKVRARTTRQKSYLRRLTDRYKLQIGCKHCGYKKCVQALESHHIKSNEKDNHIARMVCDGVSIRRIKAEVRKCWVLCPYCH